MTGVNKSDAVTQEDFRNQVLIALLRNNRMTVADLARRIGRPRPTVSTAINQGRFREVRKLIKAELNLK